MQNLTVTTDSGFSGWVGVDLGGRFAAEIDPRHALEAHVWHRLGAADLGHDLAAGHNLPPDEHYPYARLGVSVHLTEPPPPGAAQYVAQLLDGAVSEQVAHAAATGGGGRCMTFAGRQQVPERIRVGELLRTTAIAAVQGLGCAVADDALIIGGSYLRPTLEGGRLVLLVGPAAGGTLMPLEQGSRHECCQGGH